jgi:hypothetical protein
VSFCPAWITVSNRALIMPAYALRHRRAQLRTRWRRLDVGEQALPVLSQGQAYIDLDYGFGIGTTTVLRYVHEALDVLTVMAGQSHDTSSPSRGYTRHHPSPVTGPHGGCG